MCRFFLISGGLVFMAVVTIFPLMIGLASFSESEGMGVGSRIPDTVLKWEPVFLKEAQKYDLVAHIPILMAIATVESGGRLPDIMQSSESAGLPMNTINNEPESIAQGVKHYNNALQIAREKQCDDWTVIQAYNYGVNYVSYIAARGKQHTLDLAESYSRDIVAPSLGNHVGNTYQYVNAVSIVNGRQYLYWNGGNFHYVDLVRQYVPSEQWKENQDYILPLDPPNITSWFGLRVLNGVQQFHRGIDFGHPEGTPIKAISDGVVLASEYHASWGNYVRIQHQNGYCSLYAHNAVNLVHVGEQVKQGDLIGLVGNTGNSFGPHLHLEISLSTDLSQKNLIDPAKILGIVP